MPAPTLFSRLLVAGPLATVLLALLLALPIALLLYSASLLTSVLPLLNVPLALLGALLTLVTVGLSLMALLLGLAVVLAALGLMLLVTALSTRLLVARRERLVTGGLSASTLMSALWTAGTTLLASLPLERLLVSPVTRLWILSCLLGRLLVTELWALPAPRLGRRLATVSLWLLTARGLILGSSRRWPRLTLPTLLSPVPLRAFRLPLWRLVSLR